MALDLTDCAPEIRPRRRLNYSLNLFLGAGETVLEPLEILFPVIWIDVYLTWPV